MRPIFNDSFAKKVLKLLSQVDSYTVSVRACAFAYACMCKVTSDRSGNTKTVSNWSRCIFLFRFLSNQRTISRGSLLCNVLLEMVFWMFIHIFINMIHIHLSISVWYVYIMIHIHIYAKRAWCHVALCVAMCCWKWYFEYVYNFLEIWYTYIYL